MSLLIAGLALFLGSHLVPVIQPLRARLVTRLGDLPYRGLFAAIAALGLLLIIVGYHLRPERVQLFAPYAAARGAKCRDRDDWPTLGWFPSGINRHVGQFANYNC